MTSRLTLDPTPVKPPGCRRVHEARARQREIGAALDGHTVARRHEELLGAAMERAAWEKGDQLGKHRNSMYLIGIITEKKMSECD